MAFLGVDMEWHPDGEVLGTDEKYHPENWSSDVYGRYHSPSVYLGIHLDHIPYSSPWKFEGKEKPDDPAFGSPGSFVGIDGHRYQADWFYGTDGIYHRPDAYYDVTKGKYSDVP